MSPVPLFQGEIVLARYLVTGVAGFIGRSIAAALLARGETVRGIDNFITGKRYMAHNGTDPGEREPLGIYWYEYFPKSDGSIEWVKHVVDYSTRTGAGMQVAVADVDGDGDLDFAVGGKTGLFLFENMTAHQMRSHASALKSGAQRAGRKSE